MKLMQQPLFYHFQTVQLGMSLTMRWKEPRLLIDKTFDFGNGSKLVPVEAALVDKHLWRPGQF